MSDPATAGLILVSNYPLLGSAGVRKGMDQSDRIWAEGLICPEICDFPTYYRYYKNVLTLLQNNGRRAVTNANMDRVIPLAMDEKVASISVGRKSKNGSRRAKEEVFGDPSKDRTWSDQTTVETPTKMGSARPKGNLVVMDLGIRSGIISYLRGDLNLLICHPDHFSDEMEPDGIMISNGPGDLPSRKLIAMVKKNLDRLEDIPVFAYGMGALALFSMMGWDLEKLRIPHRGSSIMVGPKFRPSYQNHLWYPVPEKGWNVTERCRSDDTPEGITNIDKRIFATMYDPLPDIRSPRKGQPFRKFREMVMEGTK